MEQTIQKLKNIIQDTYQQERNLEHQIKQLHILRKSTNLQIWETCNHEWIFDVTSNFDDPCKWICRKCDLYKRKEYYM